MSSAIRSRRLILLGSTGSIGVNTLAVVEHLAACGFVRFEIVGLAAGNRAETLLEQARRFDVKHVAIAAAEHAGSLSGIEHVYSGPDSALRLIEAVARPGDLVVGAMVGSAGVPPTIAAIQRGCDIALANKETLVAAGALVMPLVRKHGVNMIPVDSEHSAIFQCLEGAGIRDAPCAMRGGGADGELLNPPSLIPQGSCLNPSSLIPHPSSLSQVKRLVITASGGPFRTWSQQQIDEATVADALNHPTWNMGPKVTIDSASLMNKAAEVIEAHWLFDMPASKIDAIVHPQSLIHSFVEFVDGSVIAQLGPPDMKTPIQYALTWPDRADGCSATVDWASLSRMDFEPIDHERFGALRLAYRVIEAGGTSGAIFNAANEAAVAAFLDEKIGFTQISDLVRSALDAIEPMPVTSMDDVIRADAAAREFVVSRINAITSRDRKGAVEPPMRTSAS